MPLKIVAAGDPVLRRPARPLTPEEIRSARIRKLIEQMREAMYKAPGVGLAAPQVGESLQLVVLEDQADLQKELTPQILADMERVPVPFQVLINPEFVERPSTTAIFFEGCLSVPGYRALVPRQREVEVHALNEKGESVVVQAAGWHARILQHELDHLAGTMYVDRMWPRTLCTAEAYNELWRNRPVAEVAAVFGV